MWAVGPFHSTCVNPEALGLLRGVESLLLMTQAAERKSMPGVFDEAVYRLESQDNLLVKGFDSPQQTTGLGRLRQMETKSVSVRLYTEQACCGSPSRHSGSSSAFKYWLRPLHWHYNYSWSAYGSKTHIKPRLFFGEFLTV